MGLLGVGILIVKQAVGLLVSVKPLLEMGTDEKPMPSIKNKAAKSFVAVKPKMGNSKPKQQYGKHAANGQHFQP